MYERPVVRELPRKLEPVDHDTFIDDIKPEEKKEDPEGSFNLQGGVLTLGSYALHGLTPPFVD